MKKLLNYAVIFSSVIGLIGVENSGFAIQQGRSSAPPTVNKNIEVAPATPVVRERQSSTPGVSSSSTSKFIPASSSSGPRTKIPRTLRAPIRY